MGGNFQAAFWISYLGLILAFWLGIFLVTRNPRHKIAWLTAGALWCIAASFLNILLAMDAPDVAYWPAWLSFFTPFWKSRMYTGLVTSWLQGWTVLPAVAFWHHATCLLLPGKNFTWRNLRVVIGYLLGLFSILLQSNAPILFWIENDNPAFLHSQPFNLWAMVYGGIILLLAASSVFNLSKAALSNKAPLPQSQLVILLCATVILSLVGVISLLGVVFNWQIPLVEIALATGLPIGLIGYAVAHFSALMQGRTIRRDFYYNLALLALIIAIYMLVSLAFMQFYRMPGMMMVVIPMLAVITHFSLNPLYRLLDWLFFRSSTRQLRSNLRSLLRMAIEGKTLEDSLAEALLPMCKSVQATYGVIIIFDEHRMHPSAAYHLRPDLSSLTLSDLLADDVVALQAGQLSHPFENAALLVPLYADATQLGALILGSPVNGPQYAHDEIDELVALSDQLSDAIYITQLKNRYVRQVVELNEAQRHSPEEPALKIPVEVVEAALRNLHNYAFLADSPLAGLQLVHARLAERPATHLDRGKVIQEVLIQAMEKLCPQASAPRDLPPREWHPYLILWQAYREEKSNREIMAHLYISEGTFNRTRRSAIRAIARAISEMETGMQKI